MTLIEYSTCSTCKKARKWLEERHIPFETRHLKEENPSYEELKAWYIRSGLPLKRFFNTSGALYKALKLKDKLPGMPEEEQLHLLSITGMLVKRPILLKDDIVLVGFKEKEWIAAFEQS